jgi:hypothetical protein
MSSWYDFYIEEPIREIVHQLRDNGINTECSCGHRMYVQCAYWDKDELLSRVYIVMCNIGIKNYQIILNEDVRDGYKFSYFDLMLPDEKGNYSYEKKWNDNYIEKVFTKQE